MDIFEKLKKNTKNATNKIDWNELNEKKNVIIEGAKQIKDDYETRQRQKKEDWLYKKEEELKELEYKLKQKEIKLNKKLFLRFVLFAGCFSLIGLFVFALINYSMDINNQWATADNLNSRMDINNQWVTADNLNSRMDINNQWVTVDSLNSRTCPALKCGITATLKFRERAPILEQKNGWVRITKYYNAFCVNGISQYVDSGNKKCVSSNGIRSGEFAEWVLAKHLSSDRPADQAVNAPARYVLVKGSSDFRIHKDAFAKAANQLIDSNRCSSGDFIETGGWMKSFIYKKKPIYFTFCGGVKSSNKVYLNAATGEITRSEFDL